MRVLKSRPLDKVSKVYFEKGKCKKAANHAKPVEGGTASEAIKERKAELAA